MRHGPAVDRTTGVPPVRLRLLVLTPVFPPARGGIETLTEAIVRGLGPDWVIEVVTSRESGSAAWDKASGLTVHRAKNHPRGGRRATFALNLTALRRARRFRPDVVLSMYVRCAPAAMVWRLFTGSRWVQYYHAKEIPARPAVAGFAARRADVHVAVSRYTADLVVAAGADAAGVVVVPPAVSTPGHGGDGGGRADGAGPVLLSISRLEDTYKGHDVVLAALPLVLARYPEARWVVVGDGDLRPTLTDQVARAGLTDRVSFRGFVGTEERAALLRSSDVFVLPSRVPAGGRGGEGFGIVYLEAAAHGLPVVAGRDGGVRDAVEDADAVPDSGTGLLVDATDPSAVAGGVLRILDDPELGGRLRRRGPTWAARFSPEHLAARLDPVLRG